MAVVRIYTYNTPISKGKYRLAQVAQRMLVYPHRDLRAAARDGRPFWIDLSTGMHDRVYFYGEYELALSEIVRTLIEPGDTCIDAGANFGWYATMFSKLAGPEGRVVAFEPVSDTFTELQRNVALQGSPSNLTIEPMALGDRSGEIDLYLGEGQSTGHASFAKPNSKIVSSARAKLRTLDIYLDENKIEAVDLIKIDVEGAELMLLAGANKLFDQKVPPIFMMEVAKEQAAKFGATHNDILGYLDDHGEFDHFLVDETRGGISRIDRFPEEHIGGNIFSMPKATSPRKSRAIETFLAEGA
ncbi:MAG TPA: FkbM family methyltransferase [Pyrinomonadaceae bacterium]|nr:FkbM family methyltransferase [Pyrinomonadaceae bacterium]